MEVEKKQFPTIMRNNDEIYFSHIIGVLESVDEYACLQITRKTESNYSFRIAPSLPKYINSIIEELVKFNSRMGIRMDMSKSMKTNATIAFDILLE